MNERVAAFAAALLVAACAAPPTSPDAFSFAVMGDAPYHAAEEPKFEEVLARVNAEDLAFAVHVGDTKGGGPCSDAFYEMRRAQFDSVRHPFVYTPGDNEWLECRDAAGRPIALERLARLREIYFSRPESLGATRIPLRSQSQCLEPQVAGCGCGALPENAMWSRAGIHFVTLHIVGENDDFGYDAARDVEARCRREGNLRWLARATGEAMDAGAKALVVVTQADPWFTTSRVFDSFVAALQREAKRFARPVLFVHGDSHAFRVDWPLEGITRLETYGSPFVGWVKVTVSPGEAAPFRFDGRLVAVVPDAR